MAQKIIKGDDTYFNGIDLLGAIKINTVLSITGWKAEFIFQNSRKFLDINSANKIQPRFTKDETSRFVTGISYATLRLYDTSFNLKTVFSDLPYEVVEGVEGKYV